MVVYNVSRLARKVMDHQTIRLALLKLGIGVRAVTESFDDSASGKLVENMLAVIAQFDNDMRDAARTVDGMREALSRGRWTHQPPLGYLKPTDRTGPSLVPDPDRAPLVRRGFERYATGRHSKREVLDELNALGLRTQRGERVSLQTFGSMLRNPLYIGVMHVPAWDFTGPGDFEPILEEQVFLRAQALIEGRRPAADERRQDHPDFPLRRFVRCASCDTPLTASWSKGRNRRYGYYRCRNGCQSSVPKAQIERGRSSIS